MSNELAIKLVEVVLAFILGWVLRSLKGGGSHGE
jgi:hypothetical protein